MFSLKLLGGGVAYGPQGPIGGRLAQRRRLALLAVLALAGRKPVSRDRLLALFWPEADAERARHSLADSVYQIRKELSEKAVVSVGEDLQLNAELIASDVAEFEGAIESGKLQAAVKIYAGPLLDGFHLSDAPEFERWVDGERERLARAYARAVEKLAEDAVAQGDARGAADWWRLLLAHDRYSSRTTLRLMEALEAAGDRVSAIQQARIHAALLEQDFAAEPDPEVRAFAEHLRSQPARASLRWRRQPVGKDLLPDEVSEIERGFDMNGDDRVAETSAIVMPIPKVHHRRYRLLTLIAVVAVALLTATLLRTFGAPTAGSADRSIAVLPFADLSADRDNQFFSDGLTDELISALSQVRSLRVAARTSSFAFRNRDMRVKDIARELNVATVLEGSVLRDRDRMRIKVQLVDAARGYSLWSRTYDRQLDDSGDVVDDIFEVQSDIAAHVIERLGIELGEAERSRVTARPADNREAYTLYLKGRYFWHERTEAGRQRALEYYEQAVNLDPGYALAWAGIADVWISRGWYAYLAPREAFPKAKHAALRALEFDSTLAAAHASLAHIHLEYDYDWAAAEHEYQRAIQLEPTYATAHHWYGGFLSAMGRHEEALAHADTALMLDPLAPIIQTWQGLRYYFARRYDDAIAAYGKAVQFNDGFAPAHWHFSWAYLEAGRSSEGLAEAQRAAAIDSATLSYVAAIGYAYARAGREDEARATLARLAEASQTRYVSAYEVAVIHVALVDPDEAFRWLDRAYAEQAVFIGYMRADPRLDPLRADPRFRRLLRKARLESLPGDSAREPGHRTDVRQR